MADIKDIVPLTLGYNSTERKGVPFLATLFGYFSAAMRGLAEHCVRSNKQHNGDEPVHWARGKSADHDECILRHSLDLKEMTVWLERNPNHPERATVIQHISYEYDARLWRAAADSQVFREQFMGAPVSFNTRLPEPAPALRMPQEISIHHYPYSKQVAVIKAIRAVAQCSLKDAKDFSESNFPIAVPIAPGLNIHDARRILCDAGASTAENL